MPKFNGLEDLPPKPPEAGPGTTQMASTVRTTGGLRATLFDELDALRNGLSNPARSNAVAKVADQLMQTVRLELDVRKHLAKVPPRASGAPEIASTSINLG